MATILAVGVATLDWIQVVEQYPEPDSEIRATQQRLWRGGNATNSLVVLSQLGHDCSWLGTLADDDFSRLITDDLSQHGIDFSLCPRVANSVTPTSHILLSQQTASRNIVHYRSLRELQASDYTNVDFSQWQWIHFEGRNIPVTREWMQSIKQQYPDITLSLEIEKPREGIETLFNLADHCLFGRDYVLAQGYAAADAFLLDTQADLNTHKALICSWGKQGALAVSATGELIRVPAMKVEVVDSRAAGDVFNAAYIHARLRGDRLLAALEYACCLAGKKCQQMGIDNLHAIPEC